MPPVDFTLTTALIKQVEYIMCHPWSQGLRELSILGLVVHSDKRVYINSELVLPNEIGDNAWKQSKKKNPDTMSDYFYQHTGTEQPLDLISFLEREVFFWCIEPEVEGQKWKNTKVHFLSLVTIIHCSNEGLIIKVETVGYICF